LGQRNYVYAKFSSTWQGILALARKDKDKSRIAQAQYRIAELKGRIANAKIERRNAPKG
jgi:hypothetical protein